MYLGVSGQCSHTLHDKTWRPEYCFTVLLFIFLLVNTDWCIPYQVGPPPSVYFCSSKLNVWANTADQAKESLNKARSALMPYFENTHKDIAKQLAGR